MSRLTRFPSLKRQRDFDAVYRRADKVWHTPSFVLFFKAGKMQASAFVAGKKVGNAVRRNRAKRRLRALFRESEARLVPGIYILVAKAPLLETDFSQLQNDWNTALKRSRALSR